MSALNGRGHKSAAQEIVEFERAVREFEQEASTALKRFHARTHYQATTDETPVEALLEPMPEDDGLDELTIGQLHDRVERAGIVFTVDVPARDLISVLRAIRQAEVEMRLLTTRRLFDYFKGDGIHPSDVLRRVYASGNHMGIEPFSLLTTRERGMMLGDSHGSQHWRMQQICVNPLVRNGARNVRAPGQKGLNARAAAARAQKGNTNRRRKRRERRRA